MDLGPPDSPLGEVVVILDEAGINEPLLIGGLKDLISSFLFRSLFEFVYVLCDNRGCEKGECALLVAC